MDESKVEEKGALPFFEGALSAGFPNMAEEYTEMRLNLNELLVKHPAATFFIRVEGDSMIGAGIHSGDLLVIDRSLTPKSGSIVVALLNGAFTVKKLLYSGETLQLIAENPKYKAIEVKKEMEFQVWGVVTYVIHKTTVK